MSNARTSQEIFEREFLELRSKLLELAASFDRMQRGPGEPDQRARLVALGLDILRDDNGDKAARIQVLFSREYSPDWRVEFGI